MSIREPDQAAEIARLRAELEAQGKSLTEEVTYRLAVEEERDEALARAEKAEAEESAAKKQTEKISHHPAVYARAGVGDGACGDAVIAACGALAMAELERDAALAKAKRLRGMLDLRPANDATPAEWVSWSDSADAALAPSKPQGSVTCG